MNKKVNTYFFVIIVLSIYIALIYQVIDIPIFIWDESRNGINAIEMYETKQYIVTTFNNEADNWNTKPPLLIWLTNIFFNLFGVSIFSLRLTSILASFTTILFVYRFIDRHLNLPFFIQLLTVLSLILSPGFLGYHIGLTADYDSLLVLFQTVLVIYFLEFINSQIHKDKDKYILIVFIAFILGFYTKSITIGFYSLGFLIILIINYKDELPYFKKRYLKLILLTITSITTIISYYLIREYYSNGYIESAINNDFLGRFNNAIENHKGDWYYYIENLFNGRITYLIYFIFFIPYLIYKNPKTSNTSHKNIQYLLILICSFLLIISLAKTKLQWYDAPIYPLIIILIAYIIDDLSNNVFMKNKNLIHIAVFLIFILCSYHSLNYFNFIKSTSNIQITKESRYLKYIVDNKKYNNISVIRTDYASDVLLFSKIVKYENININLNSINEIQSDFNGVYVLCNIYEFKNVMKYYRCVILDKDQQGNIIFKITGLNLDNINSSLQETVKYIKSEKIWYRDIVVKAAKNKLSIEHQIIYDAIHYLKLKDKIINNEIENYIVKNFIK